MAHTWKGDWTLGLVCPQGWGSRAAPSEHVTWDLGRRELTGGEGAGASPAALATDVVLSFVEPEGGHAEASAGNVSGGILHRSLWSCWHL